MIAARQCPACGSSTPVDAPRGLCVECLMRLAEDPSPHQPAPAIDALEKGPGAACDSDETPRCQCCGAAGTGPAVGELCANCLLKLALEQPTEPLTLINEPDSASVGPIRTRYFGDYELLGQIGRGGMGVVYAARQISLNRIVALKMILGGDPASLSLGSVRRFKVEAEAAAKLNHPNIVAIHEFGERDGLPFFSMQRIQGKCLDQEMATLALSSVAGKCSGKDPDRTAAGPAQLRIAKLVATVARALHYAHQQGVIHCDVKPSNILIDQGGEPHLTDFGIARLLDQEGQLTKSGVIGSPRYMSPEQASGRRGEVTAATDIYGLGVVLYELLTGQPPFRAVTPSETLRQVMEQEPPAPHDSHLPVNRDLSIICLKCLEKNVRHRYASAAELADDLERWIRHEPILARRASSTERLGRWCQRKPAIAGLAASVALLLMTVATGAVLVAWKLSRQGESLQTALDVQEAILGIGRAGLNGRLVDLWNRKEVEWITITSEERSFLTGDKPRQPGVLTGNEVRLNFGVYTFKKPVEMATKFAPLLASIEQSMARHLGRPVLIDCTIYNSYEAGHRGLLLDKMHFMRVGPSSYVSMKVTSPGISLLVAQEEHIRCAIFTRANSGITSLDQLQEKSFAFGDPESTFGTYLAKVALLAVGINKDRLGPSRHFRSHDEVVDAVMLEGYEAGSANEEAIRKYPDTEVTILYNFPNDLKMTMPFVAGVGLEPALKNALTKALLDERSSSVLTSLAPDLTGFRKVLDEEYDPLRKEMEEAREFGELKEPDRPEVVPGR